MRLAYLGPAGTHTEEAALRYAPDATLQPCPSIGAVFKEVRSGRADRGVAPVENSLQGTVTDTLDLLIHEDGVFLYGELVLSISHSLMARPGTTLGALEVVYSHPQALAQCRRYLEGQLPRVTQRASLSTAAAVLDALGSNEAAAAIAPARAAAAYGAELIASDIQDSSANATRFLVLATHDHSRTGFDRTSICFSFSEDKPGQLYAVMKEAAERSINLSKVESRPTREGLGQYYFLLDLEGHRDDPPMREVLEHVAGITSLCKVFGSYPRNP